jgi:hypothetical protein
VEEDREKKVKDESLSGKLRRRERKEDWWRVNWEELE